MIEAILTKSHGGRDQVSTFSNRYLYMGSDDIESDAARTLLLNLVTAEKAMYTTDTNYVRGIIREVDAKLNAKRGRTRSIPLSAAGTFVVPGDDKLAPAHIVATVERASTLGRPGYGYYRYCVTVSEYKAWLQNRTIPGRFTGDTVNINNAITNPFLAFMNSVGFNTFTPCLPDAWGDTFNIPRVVTSVTFGGFRINDPVRRKKGKRVQMAEGLQAEINELARLARQVWKEVGEDGLDPKDILTVVQLAAQAAKIWYTAPIMLRGRLKWPKIFKTIAPVMPAGGVAELPFGGI
jgi:hypothetical protein